ncbi:FAD-binding protein [Stemphylium lycopersici]|uniref:FAD-binding protein n=1 Tax=Stemphylium lycopersici TaxID=183478 RepID=A0A364NC46_STELY|nr:FAD-binding protein [Stemphylium lycopersici]
METTSSRWCDSLLDARLQSLILLPESDAYVKHEASYWAANTPLHPRYIVQPPTLGEVSEIVRVLANVDGLVDVRSGGHIQWMGSNNVDQGVMIDLGRMTDVTYDTGSKLASLQPGSRWGDVYEKFLDHLVCVTGGRDGNVDIDGFLNGGGNSYYAGMYGIACDNVANFEMILANGDIFNANARSHSDLWSALKGGSGNFGHPQDLWGGIRAASKSEGDQLAHFMVNVTDNNKKSPGHAYIVSYTFGPSALDILVAHAIVNTNGMINASEFREIQEIPVVIDDARSRSMVNMVDSHLLPSSQQNSNIDWQYLNYADQTQNPLKS